MQVGGFEGAGGAVSGGATSSTAVPGTIFPPLDPSSGRSGSKQSGDPLENTRGSGGAGEGLHSQSSREELLSSTAGAGAAPSSPSKKRITPKVDADGKKRYRAGKKGEGDPDHRHERGTSADHDRAQQHDRGSVGDRGSAGGTPRGATPREGDSPTKAQPGIFHVVLLSSAQVVQVTYYFSHILRLPYRPMVGD